MAEIRVEREQVSIELSLVEKIGALHGDLFVPRLAVRSVRIVEGPFREIKGFRSPGTWVPRVMALGTWRRRDGRDFVAVYRGERGIVVEIDARQGNYQRFILSAKDPDRIRERFAATT